MSILNFNKWLINESVINSYISGISDTDVVAATIVGEAGGESITGMQAIKNVLDNRAAARKTSTAGEALRPRQFSMWDSVTSNVSTKSDYNPELINDTINMYKEHEYWDDAVKIAKKKLPDLTKGAIYYYAHNKIKPPYWTKDWTKTVVIGNHTFGKL